MLDHLQSHSRLRHLIAVLILASLWQPVRSQSNAIDSLEHLLTTQQSDSLRYTTLLKTCSEYWFIDSKKAIDYGTQALQLAEDINDPTLIGRAHRMLAPAYDIAGQGMVALSHLRSAESIFNRLDQPMEVAKVNSNMGVIYTNLGLLPEAIESLQKTLKIYDEEKYKGPSRLNTLVNISNAYKGMGHNTIDTTYYNLSLQYQLQALAATDSVEYPEQREKDKFLATVFGNIGALYLDLKDYSKAEPYLIKGLELAQAVNDEHKVGLSYQNLAIVYRMQEDHEKAVRYGKLSIKSFDAVGSPQRSNQSLVNLSEVYLLDKHYDSAIFAARKAFFEARRNHWLNLMKDAGYSLTEAFSRINRYDSALHYHREADAAKDSVFTTEKAAAIANLETRFQLEKQGTENTLLRSTNEKQQLLLVLVIGLLVLALLVAYFFFRGRIREKNLRLELDIQNQRIQQQNEELVATIENLKSTQRQLLQSEKMASLGLLAAGIAHEINNPINFVSGGVQALEENLRELKENINAHATAKSHEVLTDISDLMGSIRNGVTRTTNIVSSLKLYVKTDEAEMSPIDVHECLDSSLVILNSKIRDHVKLTRHYGDVGLINGYHSKLSQVFLNLIDNAVQAIIESGQKDGEIIVSTSREGAGKIRISIKDNGSGIPHEIQQKIFSPFFTTKQVGQGTGLGLYLSYNIVAEHHGELTFTSTPGEGTEFTVTLPK